MVASLQKMSERGAELLDMAGGGTTKKGCFTRCPGTCCVTLWIVLALALIVCAAAPLLLVYVLQPEVNKVVDQNVVLTPGSVGLSQFKVSSAPLYSEYYMYHLVNAHDVKSNGARPQLQELGPFVYRENRTKYNTSWEEDNNVLKYSMMINYTFDDVHSYGQDPMTTQVTTINVPLIGVLQQLEALEKSVTSTVEKELVKRLLAAVDYVIEHAVSGEGLFVTKTVHELLWGYEDNLLTDIKKIQDEYDKLFHKNLSLVSQTSFGFGNLSSVESPNRVFTGANDTKLVGVFIQWDGNYQISGWGSPYARMINGTGGFLFYPGVTRTEPLIAFINELYRSGYFSYQRDVVVDGITLYKFELPKEELLNTSQDPGFYANGPSGVLNLTAVVPSNVPLFVSKPHFLDADPAYLANVSGLTPNRTIHDSYLAVEPITGSVLDAAKRIQVNLRLTKYSSLPHLATVRDLTMLPVYWVAQTGKITPPLADKFKAAVYGVVKEIDGGVWGIVGLAGLIAVVCVLCLFGVGMSLRQRRRVRTRRVPPINTETSPLLTDTRTDI